MYSRALDHTKLQCMHHLGWDCNRLTWFGQHLIPLLQTPTSLSARTGGWPWRRPGLLPMSHECTHPPTTWPWNETWRTLSFLTPRISTLSIIMHVRYSWNLLHTAKIISCTPLSTLVNSNVIHKPILINCVVYAYCYCVAKEGLL